MQYSIDLIKLTISFTNRLASYNSKADRVLLLYFNGFL